MTALHHAAIAGQEEAVRVLVQEFKVDPDIPDAVSISILSGAILHDICACCSPNYRIAGNFARFNVRDFRDLTKFAKISIANFLHLRL